MSATSVGQIGLDLVVNQKQFNKQMSGIQSLASKVGKTLAGAFAVKKIVDFGKECVNLGSDLQEVQNVVDVVFPNMTEKINEFSQSAATSFGLSETMAKKFTGTYGAMAKAFGFAEDAAYEMSTTLTGLAGDVASFYNITQDEAYTKLKSVFTGETETLKDLGVVMTQSALDSYALANGFGKVTSAMSEAEKVALRYSFVQEKLAAAQGDFIRTSDGWANQVRILKLQFDSLKATIGQGLIAAFTPVIKVINTVLLKVQGLANAFKNLMEGIFGKQSSETSAFTNAVESASQAAADTASSTGATANNLKKAKGTLAGFDRLNNLSTDTSSSGSGSGSGSGGTVSGTTSNSEGTQIDDTGLQKKFGVISDSMEKFNESAKKLVDTIKSGLSWCFENVLVPLGNWTIQEVAPRVIEILADAMNILNEALIAFKPIWEWIWENFLKPIASFAADVFIKALDLIHEGLSEISTWMEDNQGTVTLMEGAVLGFMGAWKVTEIMGFIQMSGGLINILGKIATAIYGATVAKLVDKVETMYLTGLYAKDFVVSVGKTVGALVKQSAAFIASTAAKIADTVAQVAMTAATVIWNGVCAVASAVTSAFGAAIAFLTSPIGLVIIAITALIAAAILLYKNWDKVKEVALDAWEKIKDGISVAVEKIKTIFGSIVSWFKQRYQDIKNVFASVGNWFGEKFTNAYNAIKKPFEKIGSFFGGVYDTVKSKFKAIGTMAGEAIGGGFKAVINSVLKTIENTVNKGFGFINTAIGVINKIPGVNVSKIKDISLPRLAQGGYVKPNTPQLAMIGDNRHQGEVVAPEDKLTEMALNAARMAGGNFDYAVLEQIIILLEKMVELLSELSEKDIGIAEKDLFNSVRKNAKLYKDRTGNPAFPY